MMRTVTVVRQYLAAGFLIAIGLIPAGCGDTASVNPSAQLASLTVTTGTTTATLQPAFNPGTTNYTVNLSNDVTSVTVSAQPAVSGDTVSIDNQATTSKAIDLGQPVPAGSTTTVSIAVSGSGTSPTTYTISLVRAGVTGNNSLQGLAVSPGNLAPDFDANLQSYTVDVANNVESITVTPTLSDPAATMTVNGQPAISGQPSIVPLKAAGQDTAIPIVVTAQNSSAKTYTVTVSRGVSGNFNLRSLTVSPGTLAPAFRASTLVYAVNLPSNASSITVTPTLQDTTARMNIGVNGGQPSNINSGQARTVPLGGPNSNTSIQIVVTAQNGSRNTYLVVVNKAASSNNNLSALRVTPGTLTPRFAAGTLNYRVNVATNVENVTVSATKADPNAVMAIGSVTVPAGTRTGQASITLGGQDSDTPVSITVTAPSGATQEYRITIHRAAPSSNNDLSALSVSVGTARQPLSPTFAPNTTDYTASVANDVNEVTVSATKDDANAVMAIGSVTVAAGTATGQAPITLTGTDTPVSITVTAQNGTVRQPPYTITVRRAAAPPPPAPANAPDLIAADDSCLHDPATNNCIPPTSDTDNITNVSTPRFQIPQPAAGETPSLYVDGTKVDSTFDQAANTLRPTAALSDGDHAITSTVTNGVGESQQSQALTVTIDTVAPTP
jgi:hypothetical protein